MEIHPIKILVLDDNEEDIQYLLQSFTANKVRNDFAFIRDGAEALAYLWRVLQSKEGIAPDLLFISHSLKLKNQRVSERISNHPRLRDIPSIVLFKCEQEFNKFNQSNPFDRPALMKSFKIESLVAVLHRVNNLGLAISRDSPTASV